MVEFDYSHPLALTTPHARGPRVRKAQDLLAGHNAWHDNSAPIRTYTGRLDSEYGPATASATKRAKYWLGYPTAECDRIFGELVYNLLNGKSSLSAEYAERRKKRLAEAAKPASIKLAALKKAESYIGTKESPFGSNMQMFGSWYGMNGVPWCAIFASYCISHAGRPWKYSYVPRIVDDARRGRGGMGLSFSPTPGDLVAYTIHGSVDCHVAFFHHWADEKHHSFYDLGGNTGSVNFSNGGEVLKQVRTIDLVSHFVRLYF